MSFESEAQRRYMWANHPEIARRWANKYGTPSNLPKYKKALKRKRKKRKKR